MRFAILRSSGHRVDLYTVVLVVILVVLGCKNWRTGTQSNMSNAAKPTKSGSVTSATNANAASPTPMVALDTPEKTFDLEPDPSKVRIFPDAKMIVTSNHNREINIWDLATGTLKTSIKDVHPKPIIDVAISNDGKLIATGADEGAKLWDTSGKLRKSFIPIYKFEVHSVAISPKNDIIATSTLNDAVKLWDAKGNAGSFSLMATTKNFSPKSLDFSPDGKHLVVGGLMGGLVVYEMPAGKLEHDIKLPNSPDDVTAEYSPDAKWIVAGVLGGTVYLIDAASGEVKLVLKGHTSVSSAFAFSPDGKTLATGSNDNEVILWDVATGNIKRTIHAHSSYVSDVAFMPDGKTLLSASSLDKTVKWWKLAG